MNDNDTPSGLPVALTLLAEVLPPKPLGDVSSYDFAMSATNAAELHNRFARVATDYAALLAERDALRRKVSGLEGGATRGGRWRLVPEDLPNDSLQYLAHFDMDDVGNNPGDAAHECWMELLDRAGRRPPELQFSNPVFNGGANLTVRRGEKWYGEMYATVVVGETPVIVTLSTMTHPFYLLNDHYLRNEHDPSCRTVEGLRAEMCRVYPGFKEHETVTLVHFDLPPTQAAISAMEGR